MQKILGLMRRAIEDYNMIEDGDRVAVGVSGGKDSVTLLEGLAKLRKFYPKRFEVVAITLDLGFGGMETDLTPISHLCDKLDVEYIIKRTKIGEIVFDIRKEANPCSLCATLRRGCLHNVVLEAGCNKLALGHHLDDSVETFLMNLIYEGRIGCFSPVTYLSRKNIHMIRPMIYVPEQQIIDNIAANNLPIIKNPCTANGFTQRQRVKNLITELEGEHKGLKSRLFGAMKRAHIDNW